MPTYKKEQGGSAILDDLRDKLAKANATLGRVASDDSIPAENRRRVRTETLAELTRLVSDARSAFHGWADDSEADARRRYREDPVASAAEEARRNTVELRLGRLVDTGRAADERTGPRVIDLGGGEKRVVENGTAHDYADRAASAYVDGLYDDAQLYARASMEMGGPATAQQAFDAAQGLLDAKHPRRAQALKDIATAERARAVFERDVNAAASAAYQAAAAGATAIGDDHREFTKAATGASVTAKLAALALAEKDDRGLPKDYEEPRGVLASGPTGEPVRVTDGELDRLTSRVGSGA